MRPTAALQGFNPWNPLGAAIRSLDGMDDLHLQMDKVAKTTEHINLALKQCNVELALATAKRGRRELTLLVRQLAENRDNATAQEA